MTSDEGQLYIDRYLTRGRREIVQINAVNGGHCIRAAVQYNKNGSVSRCWMARGKSYKEQTEGLGQPSVAEIELICSQIEEMTYKVARRLRKESNEVDKGFSTVSIRRRIQHVAKTTYTISLPHDWVDSMELKKGDELTIYPQKDGTLVVSKVLVAEERGIEPSQEENLS